MEPSITFRTDLGARLRDVTRGWWRMAVATGLVLLLALGVVTLTRSGLFRVRTIRVEGAGHLSRGEVVRLAGVTRQDNAVWLDEEVVEDRLMSASWVATANVEVDLPWTITITITERSPIAIVDRGGTASLVAGDGTILGPVPQGVDLPTILVPPSWLKGGVEADLGAAARALTSLGREVRDRVRRVALGGPEGMQLYLSDGVLVSFGGPGSPVRKAHAVADVLAWADATGEEIRSINVTAPSAPVVVPAS